MLVGSNSTCFTKILILTQEEDNDVEVDVDNLRYGVSAGVSHAPRAVGLVSPIYRRIAKMAGSWRRLSAACITGMGGGCPIT